MTLIKMDYVKLDPDLGSVVCAVPYATLGGEFTLCGYDIVEDGDNGVIISSGIFKGKRKDITCPRCKAIIDEIRSWK